MDKTEILTKLKNMGIDTLVVEYDGEGDSGSIQKITIYPEMVLDEETRDAIEEYVYSKLPDGWEINEGSFGEVIFNITTMTVMLEYNERNLQIYTSAEELK